MGKPEHHGPWPYVWSPESIRKFWDMVACSPLDRLSFAKMVAPRLVQLVSAQVDRQSRILDFGAGDGDFCLAMMQAGYKVAVYEPSEGRSNGFLKEVERNPNFLGAVRSGSFACITCFEVLEHIVPEELQHTMSLIHGLLEPGGTFMGTVPANEDLELGQCVCPHCGALFHRWQHMRSFSAQSLAHFLQSFGFNVKTVQAADFAPSLVFIATRA